MRASLRCSVFIRRENEHVCVRCRLESRRSVCIYVCVIYTFAIGFLRRLMRERWLLGGWIDEGEWELVSLTRCVAEKVRETIVTVDVTNL